MIDRSREIVDLLAVHLADIDLGRCTAMVDSDALTVVGTDAEDRRVRLPLSTIDSVAVGDDALMLGLEDGSTVRLAMADASRFANHVLAHCCTLPELTRTLRAFGSRRGQRTSRRAGAAEQQRFFGPLVEARRSAARGGAESPFDAIEYFDAAAIESAINTTLAQFAAERYGESGPARRALEAELTELAEPLYATLVRLGESAVIARQANGDLRAWRAWCGALKRVFEAADRAWLALDAALDATMYGAS
jgi:hypothetical protein